MAENSGTQAAAGLKKMAADVKDASKKVSGEFNKITKAYGSLKKAVAPFAGFEQSMAGVAAVTGATGAELAAMESVALDMGRKTTKTAVEAAGALKQLSLAGWDVDRSIAGLEPILRTSEAFSLDLSAATGLVAESSAALGVEADGLEGFLDAVAVAQQNTSATGGELLEAFKGAGGSLRAMNADISESAAILGLMADQNIKGAAAGKALSGMLAGMADAGGESAAVMAELGVSARDSEGNWRSLEAVFTDLQSALEGYDSDQQAHFGTLIAGEGNTAAFRAVLDGLSDGYGDLKARLQDCDGALQGTAGIMTGTLQGAMTRLTSASDDMKIRLAGVFGSELQQAIDWVAFAITNATDVLVRGVEWFAQKAGPPFQWIKEHAVAAFEWIRDIGGKAMEKIQERFVAIQPQLQAFGEVIVEVGGLFRDMGGKLQSGFDAARPAIEWLFINGLPAMISGAGKLLGVATDVYSFFRDNWSTIQPIVIGIGTAFALWRVPDILGKSVEGLLLFKSTAQGLPGTISKLTTAQWGLIKAKLVDKAETLQLAGLYAKDLAVAFAGTLKNLVTSTGAWIANTAQMVAQKAALLAMNGAKLVSTGVTTVMTAAQWALNAAFIASPVGWIVLGIGALIAAGVALYQNWDVVKEKAVQLWEGIQSVFAAIPEWFGGIWEGAKETFKGFINFLIGGLNKIPQGINGLAMDIPDWVPIVGGKSLSFSIPEIPLLAEGGIATRAALAVVGEGRESEAILPLSKLSGMLRMPSVLETGALAALLERFLSGGQDSGTERVSYSPTFVFEGPVSREMADYAADISFQKFEQWYARMKSEHKRKGLGSD